MCVDCEGLTEDESPNGMIRILDCDWEDITWEEPQFIKQEKHVA